MRLRKVKNALAKILEHPELVIKDPASHKGHWHSCFNNENPVYLEIGMGKGQFIIAMAIKYSGINFIGIEKEASVLVRAVEKKGELDLPNLLFLQMDAFDLDECFAPEEIDRIYLNFSDPWPKKKHEKRRLTNDRILSMYKNILSPKGLITMKTDNVELYNYSLAEFTKNKFKILRSGASFNTEGLKTEYEERFIMQEKTIYQIDAQKEE